MLQGYTHNQALRMYRKYGVRVAVPCSAHALAKAYQRKAASTQGLQSISAAQLPTVVRAPYQTLAAFGAAHLNLQRMVYSGVSVSVALAANNFSARKFA